MKRDPPLPSPPPVPPTPARHPRVELRLLGIAALAVQGRASATLVPRDALLLALLALDGAMPRKRLALMLWPDTPPAGGRANLRQRIKKLQDQSGYTLLLVQGSNLALAPQVRLDLADLATCLRADPNAAQGQLLEQLDLDIDDTAGHWLERARQRVNARRSAVLLEIAQSLEDQRQWDAAVAIHDRLIAENPLDEAAVRRLMHLHFRHGNRNAALRVYRALAERVHEQQHKPPDAQTRELAELIEATPAAQPTQAPAAAAWAALLRPPRLVQREAEWAQLQQSWQAGAVILVSGEAGIGKTRLINDFADAMAVPLRLRAQAGDRATPYALLARWVQAQAEQAQTLPDWARAELARLAPDLGAAPAFPLQPLRLAQAVQHLAGHLPAIVLDDLHFADAATLELLPAVLSSVGCCLLASRTEEMPAPLQHWLDEAGHHVTRVALLPWDEAGVHGLLLSTALPVDDAKGWARLLWQHTGGQPLLLLETLRAMLLAAPRGLGPGLLPATLPMAPQVLQLVRQRLAQLPEAARRLLQVATLAGGAFSPALAAAVLEQPLAALSASWSTLTAAALMAQSGRVHDLVFEATRAALSAPEATALHRAIAGQLAPLSTAPTQLALHWAAGGEPARAAACYEAAATRAASLSRRVECAEHHVAAAQCWQQAGDSAQAFRAGAAAAMAWLTAGDTQRSLELCDTLLARATSLHEQTEVRRVQTLGLVYTGKLGPALALLKPTHAASVTLGHTTWRGELAALGAHAAAALGDSVQAGLFLADEKSLPLDASDWKSNLTRLSVTAGALSFIGRVNDALQRTEASIALADRPEARAEHATLESNAASLLQQLGRIAQAHRRALRSLELHTELGLRNGITGLAARMHVGLYGAGLGQFDSAVCELNDCLKGFAELNAPARVRQVENHLIQVWTHLGQPAKALQLLRSGGIDLSPLHRLRRATLAHDLAQMCGVEVAAPELPEQLEGIEPAVRAQHQIVQARALAAPEKLAAALQLEHEFAAQERQGCALAAQVMRLDALVELRDPAAAAMARHLQRELVDHVPAITYWPQAQFSVHQALQATGQLQGARRALADAWRWIAHARDQHVPPQLQRAFMTGNLVNATIQRIWVDQQT